jgi:hypothetical protein
VGGSCWDISVDAGRCVLGYSIEIPAGIGLVTGDAVKGKANKYKLKII